MSGVIGLIVVLALLGLAVWAITTLIPMPPQFHKMIIVVAVIVGVLIVLHAFGLAPSGLPRVR